MKILKSLLRTSALSQFEYAVRGRRWMDCIGRLVMRPSDREIASQSIDSPISLVTGLPQPKL